MPAGGAHIVEVKRNLDGRVLEFDCRPLVVEPGRAVVLFVLEEPLVVADGALELPAGTRTYGYFWLDRPYTVYHWLHGEETLAYYVNVGRVRSIDVDAVVWDDYAVDVLAWPDGRVSVLDEDEVPEDADEELRRAIAEGTARILDELDAIAESVERETRALEEGAHAGRRRGSGARLGSSAASDGGESDGL